jgi:hypothetical protein
MVKMFGRQRSSVCQALVLLPEHLRSADYHERVRPADGDCC